MKKKKSQFRKQIQVYVKFSQEKRGKIKKQHVTHLGFS